MMHPDCRSARKEAVPVETEVSNGPFTSTSSMRMLQDYISAVNKKKSKWKERKGGEDGERRRPSFRHPTEPDFGQATSNEPPSDVDQMVDCNERRRTAWSTSNSTDGKV